MKFTHVNLLTHPVTTVLKLLDGIGKAVTPPKCTGGEAEAISWWQTHNEASSLPNTIAPTSTLISTMVYSRLSADL